MSSSKKERFIKIAENRTNTIINTLRLLGNCSNKNNYEYTEEQVKQIFNAIDAEGGKERHKSVALPGIATYQKIR